MSQTSPALRAALAPTGKLRVGINVGNALLVTKGPDGLSGIVPELARALGERAGLAIEQVTYPSASKLADSAGAGAWDVAFLGAEPERAQQIAFTAPYLQAEATYLVPAGSPIRTMSDVDRAGVRIAVSGKSAYDLYLSRNIKHAELVRAADVASSYEMFVAQKLDVLGGLRPVLLDYADRLPGSRVLDAYYTAVLQALGAPQGRHEAAAFYAAFVEDIKTSGLVARIIEKQGARGVTVAPLAH